MSQSQIRIARLHEIFKSHERRQLHAKLARLCVLYEDLRVELFGIVEPGIPALDALDSERDHRFSPERVGRYRRYYFVRRSIGTLREFAEALRMINDDNDFQLSTMRFVDGAREAWDSAIAFFGENEALVRAIRNDIGGHFGHEAALNAIDGLRSDTFSSISLIDFKEFRLHFAGEIAASALLPHLENQDIAEYETLLKEFIKPAYKHAARCVQILVLEYLWWNFGR